MKSKQRSIKNNCIVNSMREIKISTVKFPTLWRKIIITYLSLLLLYLRLVRAVETKKWNHLWPVECHSELASLFPNENPAFSFNPHLCKRNQIAKSQNRLRRSSMEIRDAVLPLAIKRIRTKALESCLL